MAPHLSFSAVIVLSLLALSQSQNIHTNRIDDDNEIHVETHKDDMSPLAEAANAFMQSDHAGELGNMISNMIQADGGKTLGNMLMGAASQGGDPTAQILSGIGSMLNNNNAGAALDPALIGNVLSLMSAQSDQPSKNSGHGDLAATMLNMVTGVLSDQQAGNKDKFDISYFINQFTDFMKQSGENPIDLLFSMFNSFMGPDAKKREHEHAGHAYLLPPLLEKAHLYFDHFRHTELYKALWRVTGGEKFYEKFSIDGKFNFAKFFERLENKSFRRHWIRVITKKITDVIAVVTDPKRHKKYVNTGVSLYNGFLKSVDFPKSTLFDITRPTETLTAAANYFLKKYLNMKIDATRYVAPAVKYVEDVIRLAHSKGILFKDGVDSQELAHKLTDTINLEIIEPVARVWRAYRFAKKVPECDKYVMCLINQEDPNEKLSLPGLKTTLSKTASMFVSWFLAQTTGTSYWTLYSAITDEKDCSIRFVDKCNDFHIEEINVHKEYEHTEL